MSVFFHLNLVGLWQIRKFPPSLRSGGLCPVHSLRFLSVWPWRYFEWGKMLISFLLLLLSFLLQWFWWVWGLQSPMIHRFWFQWAQNNSHLLVPGTFLFFFHLSCFSCCSRIFRALVCIGLAKGIYYSCIPDNTFLASMLSLSVHLAFFHLNVIIQLALL